MSASKRAASELDQSDEVPIKGESVSKKAKRVYAKWTAEEDAIFAEIAEKLLKAGMWDAIKADKRLEHRKANGAGARIPVMIKKMAK